MWRWMVVVVAACSVAGAQVVDPFLTAFEAPYKQVLWQTSQGQAGAAKRALVTAEKAWDEVMHRLYLDPPEAYQGAPESLDVAVEVAGRLRAVAILLDAGEVETAHDEAEPVRELLSSLREGLGIYCLNDKLTAYHQVMEDALLLVADLTPDEVDELVLSDLKLLLPELRSRWAAATAFIAGSPEEVRLRLVLQPEQEAIDGLAARLKGTDKAAILAAVRALKPAFAKAYLSVDA